ncbi:DUF6894 family protein [Methylobacterium nigriterrae]|uniref:DUF6894 family protein n=1 Tax=Methylobacterium nigriterrae TaxID=3127512 RepID=UPI0030137E8D
MARYFFDVHDGGPRTDDIGTELSGPEEAREAAKRLLPDIAREEISADGDRRTFTVVARDQDGHAVYAATLSFVGLWLRR